MEDVTSADGVTSDHGDHWLGQASNLLLHIENVQARDAVAADVAAITANFLVTPAAEGFLAFAGENDDANGLVFVKALEGL